MALAAILVLASLHAAETPIPSAPSRWATDTAGFLSPQALSELDGTLEAFERSTGHQMLVWIGSTTGDTPTEEWTAKAFAKWKVGRKGLDDGLILFIFAKDHRVRIEVGYGLEDKVPDAIANRVIAETIVPRMQEEENDGAVIEGVAALAAAIAPGVAKAPESSGQHLSRSAGHVKVLYSELSLFQKVIIGLILLAFLILLVTHPGLALWLLFNILSSAGSGGGGGGGGGGFSGGGGGSGGGGATGSW